MTDETKTFDLEQIAATVREAACVLVVDDDARVRWTVERQLETVRAEVVVVESADHAMVELEGRNVSVLLTDERMPGMTGTELLSRVREDYPDVVRIMMTGDNELRTAVRAINSGEVFRFLMKPWSMADLHEVVKAGLAQHQALREREVFASELERANEMLRRTNERLEETVRQRTAELQAANERLEGSLEESLRMLGAMMGLGNQRVIEHCERTRERVIELCEAVELPASWHHDLELAARYHWLGLLAAPDEVFEKTANRFDPDAAATWEFHPTLTALVLSAVPALDRPAEIIEAYLLKEPPPDASDEFATAAGILRVASTFERALHLCDNDVEAAVDRLWAEVEAGADERIVRALVELVQGELAPGERLLDSVDRLEPGMVLSRMVTTYSGLPMEPAFRAATPALIERLRAIDDRVGLGEIWVRVED